jgi:3-(3-hydroxy-phenyl)propionate hydroxylase
MTSTNESTPVVIAGAGPVGLTTALVLAKAGVRSLVLEKKTQLDQHSRATLLVPNSLAIFNSLGVLKHFLMEGERNDAIRILRMPDRAPLITFDFAALVDATPTPYAMAISQDKTEHILLEAAKRTGMIEIVFNEAFEKFEMTSAGVRVHTTLGRFIDTQWLVGADGAHSGVRKQLTWRLEGKTYPTRAFLADIKIDPAHDVQGVWLADPKAESFTIAVRFGPGTWRLIESAIQDSVSDDTFFDRAKEITQTLFGQQAWQETIWTAAYRKHERRSERFHEGRVVLAGDAAHLNSPAGGQGMNAGLGDAQELGLTLASAIQSPVDSERLVSAYAKKRMAFFDNDVRALTDGIEQMETAPAWIRKLAFSAIGVARAAGVEAIVARKLSMLDFKV